MSDFLLETPLGTTGDVVLGAVRRRPSVWLHASVHPRRMPAWPIVLGPRQGRCEVHPDSTLEIIAADVLTVIGFEEPYPIGTDLRADVGRVSGPLMGHKLARF